VTGRAGRAAEVFLVFLRLGLTSFGGPAAHIGYFRTAFVERRAWLDDAAFAELVALCQVLPGPASSQVGYAVGLTRAGIAGGLAAFLGFTLPSAVLMTAFALGAEALRAPWATGAVHGLTVVAVAVIAQATLGLGRSLAPDPPRAGIAGLGLLLALLPLGGVGQLAAVAAGAVAGLALAAAAAPAEVAPPSPVSRRTGWIALGVFALLAAASALASREETGGASALFAALFRAGALVFGGGHVVLPLLQAQVASPGWVSPDRFLAGYGAAQALPGPLFAFAAYLGVVSSVGPGGVAGAAVALVGVFAPGLLLVTAALPLWRSVQDRPAVRRALRGVNAAVVGLLAAAVVQAVRGGALTGPADLALAALAFGLLTGLRMPALAVVALGAVAGALMPR
jgi:chromate transporter